MRSLVFAACLLLLRPALVLADANRPDWIGEYAMNHDGHSGTLCIMQAKCRPPMPCVGMTIQYVDENGNNYGGLVSTLDDNGQHMRFTINFPENAQVFDVYIFSFDKSKLAGTTVWGGRTFGVMATRSESVSASKRDLMTKSKAKRLARGGLGATPAAGAAQQLNADGSIAVQRSDGSVFIRRLGQCGGTVRYPDGHTMQTACSQTPPLIPPPPPSGSPQEKWLNAQDTQLFNILTAILGGSSSANFQNYIHNYENPADSVLYKRIYFRTQAISDLTSSPQ
jgi:hypothetical protein